MYQRIINRDRVKQERRIEKEAYKENLRILINLIDEWKKFLSRENAFYNVLLQNDKSGATFKSSAMKDKLTQQRASLKAQIQSTVRLTIANYVKISHLNTKVKVLSKDYYRTKALNDRYGL